MALWHSLSVSSSALTLRASPSAETSMMALKLSSSVFSVWLTLRASPSAETSTILLRLKYSSCSAALFLSAAANTGTAAKPSQPMPVKSKRSTIRPENPASASRRSSSPQQKGISASSSTFRLVSVENARNRPFSVAVRRTIHSLPPRGRNSGTRWWK